MLIAIIPVIAMIAGLLLWVLAGNAVVKDAGRILFASGTLVTLLVAAQHTVRLLP